MHDYLTIATIAELAGVEYDSVQKWRRRHPDFPRPEYVSRTPTWNPGEVKAWLAAHSDAREKYSRKAPH